MNKENALVAVAVDCTVCAYVPDICWLQGQKSVSAKDQCLRLLKIVLPAIFFVV